MSAWPAAPQPGPGVPPAAHSSPYSYADSWSSAYSGSRDTLSDVTDPAFVPVQVRRGFGPFSNAKASPPNTGYAPPPPSTSSDPSATVSAPATSEQAKEKTDWPESVRKYVQRSFLPQNDDPSVSRSEMENKLKETIGMAKENGTLYTKNWDEMPLPQALVKAEHDALVERCASSVSMFSRSPRNSKKRKSSDSVAGDPPQPTPWRATNNGPSHEDRIPHPDKRPARDAKLSRSQKEANRRKRRFESEFKAVYRSPSPTTPSSGPIFGTNETLEKRYLRLTAPPVPSNVRPERVLRQTLELLKKKWRKEGNYSYICDQFKSMRQDLTVQRIKNDFTVSVYEIHSRIALEKGDMGEYNQCQTQLLSLYGLGLKGNPVEFKAYRILYFIHTANRTALNDTLADLTAAEKEERPIKHALSVRSALTLGNYDKFFRLYNDTPNMGAYLMDMFVTRERLAALCTICKAYKPDVSLGFLTEKLAFDSEAHAIQFIVDHQGQHLLDDRQEYVALMTGKANSLFDEQKSAAFRKVDIKGQI